MPHKILLINPNSTERMTSALQPLITKLSFPATDYTYFTAPPSAPPSINNRADIAASAQATLPSVLPLLPAHDAVLVACYSPHPLVPQLRKHTRAPVVGIMEASIGAAVQLVSAGTERFGIVSTGRQWEGILGEAVVQVLEGRAEWTVREEEGGVRGEEGKGKWEKGLFAGVETTGLDATELHDAPPALVKKRVQEAAKRLVDKGDVKAVVLGCAGMSGMDEWVREVVGRDVWIVDGVMAGVAALQGVVRAEF